MKTKNTYSLILIVSLIIVLSAIFVSAAAPVISSVDIDLLGAGATVDKDLNAAVSVSDPDLDPTTLVFNWEEASSQFIYLNMPFEAGSETKDYSGNVADGTTPLGGVSLDPTAGYDGFGAMYFDGTGYIDAGDIGLVSTDAIATLSFWINPDDVSGTDIRLLGQLPIGPGLTTPTDVGGALRINSGNLQIWDGSTWKVVATGISAGVWQHIAITFDGTDATAFVDGNQEMTVVSDFDFGGEDMGIGATFRLNWGSFYQGYMDNFQVYGVVLSSEQIDALYNEMYDTLLSEETSLGDVWEVCVTPNDRISDGAEVCSSPRLISTNNPPTHDDPVLYPGMGLGTTIDDLLADPQNEADLDGDPIYFAARDWRLFGDSIALVNAPIQPVDHGRDVSTYGNDLSIVDTDVTFDSSMGGFYSFPDMDDADGDGVLVPVDVGGMTDLTVTTTVELNPESFDAYEVIFGHDTFRLVTSDYLGGDLRVAVTDDLGNTYYLYADVSGLVGDKIHVAVRFDGTSKTASLFVNGYLGTGGFGPAEQVIAGSSIGVPSWPFMIGDSPNNSGYIEDLKNAKVFNFAIYRRAMSDDYILNDWALSLVREPLGHIEDTYAAALMDMEIFAGDEWSVCLTPNDGKEYGDEKCSDVHTVLNSPPEHDDPILTSSSGMDTTYEDLTVTEQNIFDADGDDVNFEATDWKINGDSIALVNAPIQPGNFELDISTNSNDLTLLDSDITTDDSMGGFYSFPDMDDADGDGVLVPVDVGGMTDLTVTTTVELNSESFDAYEVIFGHDTFRLVTSDYLGGDLRVAVTDDLGNTYYLYADVSGLVGDKIHVAVRFDGTSKTVSLFVNGYLGTGGFGPAEQVIAGSSIGVPSWPFMIGDSPNNSGYIEDLKNAKVFNFAIYGRALSDDQLDEIASDSLGVHPVGPVSRTLVSEETNVGDDVEVCLTPNDGFGDSTSSGITKCASLTIVDLPMTTVDTCGYEITTFGVYNIDPMTCPGTAVKVSDVTGGPVMIMCGGNEITFATSGLSYFETNPDLQHSAFWISNSDDVTIDGCIITDGNPSKGEHESGIYAVGSDRLRAINNEISIEGEFFESGIRVEGGSEITIDGNTIVSEALGLPLQRAVHGIVISGYPGTSVSNLITNNYVDVASVLTGSGMSLSYMEDSLISDNTIDASLTGTIGPTSTRSGLLLTESSNNNFERNEINALGGDYVNGLYITNSASNSFVETTISNSGANSFGLKTASSSGTFDETTFLDVGQWISTDGGLDLTNTIFEESSFGQVFVKGLYQPSSDITKTELSITSNLVDSNGAGFTFPATVTLIGLPIFVMPEVVEDIARIGTFVPCAIPLDCDNVDLLTPGEAIFDILGDGLYKVDEGADLIDPTIIDVTITNPADVALPAQISVEATDNDGIASVRAILTYPDSSVEIVDLIYSGADIYTIMHMLLPQVGSIDVEIVVTDNSGNTATDMSTISAVDNDAPTLTEILVPNPVDEGAGFDVIVEASDLVGLSSVWAELTQSGTTTVTLLSDLGASQFGANLGPTIRGTFTLNFYAEDTSGNVASLGFNIGVNAVDSGTSGGGSSGGGGGLVSSLGGPIPPGTPLGDFSPPAPISRPSSGDDEETNAVTAGTNSEGGSSEGDSDSSLGGITGAAVSNAEAETSNIFNVRYLLVLLALLLLLGLLLFAYRRRKK